MDQQDKCNKATEIATEMNGEYSHMDRSGVDKFIWMHYNFDHNLRINEFMHECYMNNIGLLLKNTSKTSCAILI